MRRHRYPGLPRSRRPGLRPGRRRAIANQAREQPLDPCSGIGLVVDIAVAAIEQAHCAQLLEPAIEPLAGLAEELVGRIAQRQHGEAQPLQQGCPGAGQELEERGGALGRVSLTVGAGDEQDRFFLGQGARLVAREIFHAGAQARPSRPFLDGARQRGRVAALAGIEDSQQRRSNRRLCRARRLRDRRRGLATGRGQIAARLGHAGEIPAHPERLLGAQGAGEIANHGPVGVLDRGVGYFGQRQLHRRAPPPLKAGPAAASGAGRGAAPCIPWGTSA